jgi:hypothetical protein
MILFGCEQTIYFHDIGCILDHRLINYPSSCTSCFVLIFVSRVKKIVQVVESYQQNLSSYSSLIWIGIWLGVGIVKLELQLSSKESVRRLSKQRRTPKGRVR